MGMKSTGGEIVQVQGGHILRSTGRKDRHSKVYTAKGARDRRVRLSAHTAIQFYDVQDRLGYDRPSKAVDWLIKKAKSAIDKLAELPPWHPTDSTTAAAAAAAATEASTDPDDGPTDMVMAERSESSGYGFQFHNQNQLGVDNPSNGNASSFISQSLDSQSIADPMKCFFPTTSAASSINFHNYPPDIISRTNNQTQDLCLSLQSFRDPNLIHGHGQSHGDSNHTPTPDQALFLGPGQVGFDANSGGWSDHQPPDIGRFSRMVAWGNGGGGHTESRGGGFSFNSPPLPQPPLLGQGLAFSQRGPLQSSFSPSVRAWNDLPIASPDHHKTIHQSSISSFPGFHFPARIHGDEEHAVVSNKPSSASPNSRH